ncbi:hypothetical protein K461DRAFT_306075 [Myriangium duriaei CBS 260.36]|uniref:Uncharacterized protein n=1 Tax=Myriangium duriaei CBS 260.36 TaxID=1168546 RepID=A0A9P4J4N3_9PEZI|nr:hypothetical protein K461DRAFT_306075 [Myriangium duriaei CBS 260.36]
MTDKRRRIQATETEEETRKKLKIASRSEGWNDISAMDSDMEAGSTTPEPQTQLPSKLLRNWAAGIAAARFVHNRIIEEIEAAGLNDETSRQTSEDSWADEVNAKAGSLLMWERWGKELWQSNETLQASDKAHKAEIRSLKTVNASMKAYNWILDDTNRGMAIEKHALGAKNQQLHAEIESLTARNNEIVDSLKVYKRAFRDTLREAWRYSEEIQRLRCELDELKSTHSIDRLRAEVERLKQAADTWDKLVNDFMLAIKESSTSK